MGCRLQISKSVLVLAAIMLCFSVAQAAPDYEAVGKRLDEAVKAGELTSEQAEAMMDVLRKCGAGPVRLTTQDLFRADEELSKAVRAGLLTREEQSTRIDALRKRLAAQREEEERQVWTEQYEELKADLEKSVAEGTLGSDGMNKMLEAFRKHEPEKSRDPDLDLDIPGELAEHKAELDEEARKGRISEADARQMTQSALNRLRERRSLARYAAGLEDQDAVRILRAKMAKVRTAIDAAVKAGKSTKEQAKLRLEEYTAALRVCVGGRSLP